MKHRLLKLALAALAVGSAISVSAANPFSDVDTDSWAYQAVSELSDQNVVDGYPDGTFRGDKNISRYELAQIIAKLMAKQDSLTADQKATVAKLSQEYADDLQSLGVRVAELEKKTGNIEFIHEVRVQDVPRYDNVFKDSKEKHDELSLRYRLNSIIRVNDRSTVYSQFETYMGMNGATPYDVNRYNQNSYANQKNNDDVRNGHDDGEFHMNRLWATYQFGKKQPASEQPLGPSKNLIGIGQFPVKMGVTGYTYDGQFKGAFISFGDYQKGGRFTIAHGRATDINYNYTGPMVRGMHHLTSDAIAPVLRDKLLNSSDIQRALQAERSLGQSNLSQIMGQAAQGLSSAKNLNDLSSMMSGATTALAGLADPRTTLSANPAQNAALHQLYGQVAKQVGESLSGLDPASMTNGMYYNPNAGDGYDALYPMGKKVSEPWGDDEDVPVTYVSYIYKKPMNWEFHSYAMKANGPIGEICKAYGFAGAYYVTPMWHIQGEYVKNMRKLPLNNERPYSFNYGLHYGTADVLKDKSFEIGLDYVYSQAGTYFGGSSNDIVDQYMGHVYKNWHGMHNVPAYIADKMDAQLNGTDSKNRNYGGAKFFLAKTSFVPMKGLIIEADYGFHAKDMGGKKMDDMLMIKATAYIK